MALCALADVKTYLGIGSASTDALLTSLINNVSAAIESYCSRTFLSQTYTETRNGSGANRMYCNNAPITSVLSVAVDGYAIPASFTPTTYGWVFDTSLIYIRQGTPYSGSPNCFSKGVQNVQLVYVAGYATIPSDLAQACIEWVAYKFAKRDRIDRRSETLAQQTVGYDLSDMPLSVKSALNQYRRWPF